MRATLLPLLAPALLAAQVPQGTVGPEAALTVAAEWESARWLRADAPLTLTLSRPLRAGAERLALVVGGSDFAGLAAHEGTRVVLRPRGVRLPAGEQELVVYVVAGDAWTEVGRAPLRVLARGGFESAAVTPALTLNNAGQLAERTSAAEPPSPRRTFQDVTGSASLRSALRRGGGELVTQWNVVGANARAQALRFQLRGNAAPLVDLADWSAAFRRGGASLTAGTITPGQQRHLIQGSATRGVSAGLARGPAALTLVAASGASIVGWDNLAGLADRNHQIRAALLGVELAPAHPGALRLEGTLLDGAVRPDPGFTRGAVVSAERSAGRGFALGAQALQQRVRLRAEWSDSRFEPAPDEQLTGDTTVVALAGTRRQARWGELAVDLLRQHRLSDRVAVDLAGVVRHERVEPLFRSVAASAPADREDDAGELSLSLGGLALRAAYARTGDNLARVPSVLRTLTRTSTANAALPLAQLLPSRPWLPSLTASVARTHARADGTPTNGDFRPVDLPDQVSDVVDAGAQWTLTRWRAAYRYNRSLQDNRQPGRERADFLSGVHALTLGVAPRADADITLEASDERQVQRESDERRSLRRLGATASWQPARFTQLSAGYTATVSRDGATALRGTQADARAELSQGFGAAAAAGPRGRAFARLTWLSAETRQRLDALVPGLPAGRRLRWSVTTGLTFRVL